MSLFILFLIEPTTSEELAPFHPLVQSPLNEFWGEIFHSVMPLDDQCLPLDYNKPTLSFGISCDEYIELFNKVMSAKSYAFNTLRK